jgi:hypothetical protein
VFIGQDKERHEPADDAASRIVIRSETDALPYVAERSPPDPCDRLGVGAARSTLEPIEVPSEPSGEAGSAGNPILPIGPFLRFLGRFLGLALGILSHLADAIRAPVLRLGVSPLIAVQSGGEVDTVGIIDADVF